MNKVIKNPGVFGLYLYFHKQWAKILLLTSSLTLPPYFSTLDTYFFIEKLTYLPNFEKKKFSKIFCLKFDW